MLAKEFVAGKANIRDLDEVDMNLVGP